MQVTSSRSMVAENSELLATSLPEAPLYRWRRGWHLERLAVSLPNFGLLVSRTGTGQGDVLLGSSGSGNYVKCDHGETTPGSLTCGAPLWSVSTGSVAGPVPPCYQNGGTSCNSTFHSVKNTTGLTITTSGACSNNTWCSLSGNTIALCLSPGPSDTDWSSNGRQRRRIGACAVLKCFHWHLSPNPEFPNFRA